MQEGTSSLMQMAKVSVAVEALKHAGIPFISILNDPTYGGVSASYAMQGDVRIALSDARIGFAGPAVILNTMCGADQQKFDTTCPADFQSAEYVHQHGQVDMVLALDGTSREEKQTNLEAFAAKVAYQLMDKNGPKIQIDNDNANANAVVEGDGAVDAREFHFNYTLSRAMDRPQTQDLVANCFDSFVELSGDGKVGRDVCIRGGLATFLGRSVVVIGTYKGHTPGSMQAANYGMASPHGYRTALRLMRLAEQFGLPVVTLVDTVGAWPTFDCEGAGQSEAIATNLTAMAGLKVPIVTIFSGEGGSGGALGIGMGNSCGMLSSGYYGVISPEGAASILGRYKDEGHKAQQFPLDCQALATQQGIYANQLKALGVVDEIIWDAGQGGAAETFRSFPRLRRLVQAFIAQSLEGLCKMTAEELVQQRYQKYRNLGTFSLLSAEQRLAAVQTAVAGSAVKRVAASTAASAPSPLLLHLSEETMSGPFSRYLGKTPSGVGPVPPEPSVPPVPRPAVSAKQVLDSAGPEALARWVREQTRVLLTDTTMRDAHQSLLATRVRTEDVVKGARIANNLLVNAFSFECWGGATFDVCMRFLDECPWDRLRELRAAAPDVCLQMLIRGANAVGYTSYPDNVVAEFCRLAALNGMDVFRIFDCFNIVSNMQVAIDAVRATGKVAEVCICYTGNVLTSEIYNLEYYASLAKEIEAAGAHMLCIKDMAGLLRPFEAGPFLAAIRAVTNLPVHFHTHATSSLSLATCLEMRRHGCDIIDFATASLADGTSQPSLNAFLASLPLEDTGIRFLDLEPYDVYWSKVRDMYVPFESGMKSGSARVFEHQIPGGQYSNLIVQCSSMGLWDRWSEVLDAYRDVNALFGDIVKVTPSSKVVGDLALYLVTRNLTTADLLENRAGNVDWPESVVGLMKGELGLPHRGFPKAVEELILKGQARLTVRAGLALAAVDLSANIAKLSSQYGTRITAEQAMSYLMYPKVFTDYMTRQAARGGPLLRHLPTPAYLYGLLPEQSFKMAGLPAAAAATGLGVRSEGPTVDVEITLKRIGPKKEGKRTFYWSVNGTEQTIAVKDSSAGFVFDGPMADPSKAGQLGSPMPGVVEKMLVSVGSAVAQGDTLFTISAMKMEVKTTAPFAGTVTSIQCPLGTKVVESALILTLA